METSDGFTPITAIFYAIFHSTEGTKIINQVPENAINSGPKSLFNFNTIKNYVIPKPQLCNKLISFKVGKYKVIGYPVNVQNDSYLRNTFKFNLCFVFPYNSETISYELTIKRIGKMFKVLEEQNFLLSRLNAEMFIKSEKFQQINMINEIPGFKNFKQISLSSIESLINQIYQDLNNYSECCIPLDSSNSIDIKLFPILPPPLNIKAFQVPILLVNLSSLVDVNWDPTMIKILPYINGINSIKKISELSDSDYLLTKQCIQHLMHYKCIQIIDIFQFSNIYASTNNIDNFLKIPGLGERCQSYVVNDGFAAPLPSSTPQSTNLSQNQSNNPSQNHSVQNSSMVPSSSFKKKFSLAVSPSNTKDTKVIKVPSKTLLFYLYRSLNQGQTIKQWYIQHKKHLKNIDIRRFVNFGILNELIYRVNSFPILSAVTKSIEISNDDINKLIDDLNLKTKPDVNINTANTNINIPTTGLGIKSEESSHIKSIVNENSYQRRISFSYDVEDDTKIDTTQSKVSSEEMNELIKLVKLVKGFQNIDSICTELLKSRFEVEEMLDKLGLNGFINS